MNELCRIFCFFLFGSHFFFGDLVLIKNYLILISFIKNEIEEEKLKQKKDIKYKWHVIKKTF
jgi:NMD protein affecting ribosome stability and mRNA decay